MAHFPKHYEAVLKESNVSYAELSELFDMNIARLENVRYSSSCLDRHEFKLIRSFVGGYEAAARKYGGQVAHLPTPVGVPETQLTKE